MPEVGAKEKEKKRRNGVKTGADQGKEWRKTKETGEKKKGQWLYHYKKRD